jgi:integrating conjugative element protein (TIGR03752 family)
MIMVIVMKSCGRTSEDVFLSEVPKAPGADVDSPAETIKTLTAAVAEVRGAQKTLKEENEQLDKRNQTLHQQNKDLEVQIRQQESRYQGQQGLLAELSRKLGRVTDKIALPGRPEPPEDNVSTPGVDIPIGLGLGGTADVDDAIVWVAPLGQSGATTSGPEAHGSWRSQERGLLAGDARAIKTSATPVQAPIEPDGEPVPVYTIPKNATLVGTTSFTALIGRVPRRGSVTDPFPFRILVGADNLAANGIDIPGLYGMVWSGRALGDFTLKCVRGTLNSATFVFQDGRVRTVDADDLDNKSTSAQTDGLGEIADNQGIPCVSGELISNAGTILAQRLGVAAVEAAAAGAAASETTTVVNTSGAISTAVTGETSDFIGGQAVAGGAHEILQWLKERQESMFDAIFVEPGVKVAILVNEEITIDYDPKGRKVTHDAAFRGAALKTGLD